MDVINNNLSNNLKVHSELKQLMVNPVLLETMKKQIIQDEE